MPYILRNDLSCCEVDGHVVFLDLTIDRYFRLSGPDEAAIRSALMEQNLSAERARNLVQIGILVETAHQKDRARASVIQSPSRSAVEQSAVAQTGRLSVTTTLEIMTIIWSTKRQLRSRSLSTIIKETASTRHRNAGAQTTAGTAWSDDRPIHAAAEFSRVRRYVPIEPSCLLDSLSLIRFLSRRGLFASIVFGVTLNPFAAHCWVQAGETVLNDTLSNAQAHTPIKVI